MRMRLNEMIGKPVVSADTGEKAGRVEDVLLDDSRRHAVGVLLALGKLSRQRVLPFETVQTVGIDAVIVNTLSTIQDAKDWLHDRHPAHRWTAIRGKDVVTSDGARLGVLHDLITDADTGEVMTLEVASGAGSAGSAHPAIVDAGEVRLTNEIVVVPRVVAATRTK